MFNEIFKRTPNFKFFYYYQVFIIRLKLLTNGFLEIKSTRPIFAPGMCSIVKLYGRRRLINLESWILFDFFDRCSLRIDSRAWWSVSTVKSLP